MKKFFKAVVATAVAAAVLSTVAFAADGVIYKRDFSDGVKEDGFQGSSAKTEIVDGALKFTTEKAYESPYWQLAPAIKEAMEKNNLTEATVTISFDVSTEDGEQLGVLLRGVDNREDSDTASGNIIKRLGMITSFDETYEYSFDMTADDLAGIAAGDTYKFMFDNMKGETLAFTVDNLVVSLDELGGGSTADGAGEQKPANKPTNTGDVLPVATVVVALGAVVSLAIVSKKKREI